jgi:hypothetical protein
MILGIPLHLHRTPLRLHRLVSQILIQLQIPSTHSDEHILVNRCVLSILSRVNFRGVSRLLVAADAFEHELFKLILNLAKIIDEIGLGLFALIKHLLNTNNLIIGFLKFISQLFSSFVGFLELSG